MARCLQSVWEWASVLCNIEASACTVVGQAALKELRDDLPPCGLLLADGISTFDAVGSHWEEGAPTHDDILVMSRCQSVAAAQLLISAVSATTREHTHLFPVNPLCPSMHTGVVGIRASACMSARIVL